MRRGDLTHLGSLSVGQFDALIARGLAPFATNRRRAGWGSFTADDAFRLTLFNALSGAGLPQAQASSTVRGQYDDLLEVLGEAGEGDVWFGIFCSASHAAGEPSARAWFPLIARFDQLENEVRRVQTVSGDLDAVEAMVVVNATAVMRRMMQRAEDRGITDARLSELSRLVGAV